MHLTYVSWSLLTTPSIYNSKAVGFGHTAISMRVCCHIFLTKYLAEVQKIYK